MSQALKRVVREELGYQRWLGVTPVQREAIDNICLKFSRVLSGMGRKEHWEDVVGYGQLAMEDCSE